MRRLAEPAKIKTDEMLQAMTITTAIDASALFDSNSTSPQLADPFSIGVVRTTASCEDDAACPAPEIRRSADSSAHDPPNTAKFTSLGDGKVRQKGFFSDMKRPKTSSESQVKTGEYHISCTANRALDSPLDNGLETATAYSDTESSHRAPMCQPITAPLSQYLRRSRKRRSVSVTKRSKMGSPRRRKCSKVRRSETSTGLRRAALPYRIKGKHQPLCSLTGRKLHDVMGVAAPETQCSKKSVHGSSPDTAAPDVNEPLLATGNKLSFESMWNDTGAIHRFSRGFTDVQTGMITFDEYYNQPSFGDEVMEVIKAIDLKDGRKCAGDEQPLPDKAESLDFGKGPSPTCTNKVPNSSERRPDRPRDLSSITRVIPIMRMGCRHGYNDSHDLDQGLADLGRVSRLPQTRWLTGGKPTSKQNPKDVSNIDSIFMVEARIEPALATVNESVGAKVRSRMRKKHRLQTQTSLRTETPSGEPPERPLPELPVNRASNEIRVAHRVASSSSTRKEWLILDATLDSSPPPHASKVRLPTTVYEEETELDATLSDHLPNNVRVSQQSKPSAVTVHQSRPTSTSSSVYSQDSSRRLRSKQPSIRSVCSQRSDKIRELKRKHVTSRNRHSDPDKENVDDSEEHEALSFDLLHNRLLPGIADAAAWQPSRASSLSSGPKVPSPRSRYCEALDNYMQKRGELSDQLDKFPSVPSSRPGSRSSLSPIGIQFRGASRAASRASSLSKRHARPNGTHHDPEPAGQKLQQQVLTQSQIMIVCDTDPLNATFRAGAISPSSSTTDRRQRAGPHRGQQTSASRPCSPLSAYDLSPTKFDSIAAVTSPSPSPSMQKRHSFRNLCHQANVARAAITAPVRHGLGRISPASFVRPAARPNVRSPLWSDADPDSDSLGEHAELIPKRGSSIKHTTKGRSERDSRRSSRYRRDSSGSNTIASLSKDMDELTRVLARFDNKGIKIRGCNLEDVARQVYQRKLDEDSEDKERAKDKSDVQSVASKKSITSTHKVKMDVLAVACAPTIADPNCAQSTVVRVQRVNDNMPRRHSGASSATATATDTDTSISGHTAPTDVQSSSDLEKRESHGSLTDSAEYEPFPLQRDMLVCTTQEDVLQEGARSVRPNTVSRPGHRVNMSPPAQILPGIHSRSTPPSGSRHVSSSTTTGPSSPASDFSISFSFPCSQLQALSMPGNSAQDSGNTATVSIGEDGNPSAVDAHHRYNQARNQNCSSAPRPARTSFRPSCSRRATAMTTATRPRISSVLLPPFLLNPKASTTTFNTYSSTNDMSSSELVVELDSPPPALPRAPGSSRATKTVTNDVATDTIMEDMVIGMRTWANPTVNLERIRICEMDDDDNDDDNTNANANNLSINPEGYLRADKFDGVGNLGFARLTNATTIKDHEPITLRPRQYDRPDQQRQQKDKHSRYRTLSPSSSGPVPAVAAPTTRTTTATTFRILHSRRN